MKYETIKLGLKRDVRHARFNVSQCAAELSVRVEPGDDLESVYDEVREDLVIIVEEMCEKERKAYKEGLLSATQNQHAKQ